MGFCGMILIFTVIAVAGVGCRAMGAAMLLFVFDKVLKQLLQCLFSTSVAVKCFKSITRIFLLSLNILWLHEVCKV